MDTSATNAQAGPDHNALADALSQAQPQEIDSLDLDINTRLQDSLKAQFGKVDPTPDQTDAAEEEKPGDPKQTPEPEKQAPQDELPADHPMRQHYEAFSAHFPNMNPDAVRNHFEDLNQVNTNLRLLAATAPHRVLQELGPVAIAASKASQIGIPQDMAIRLASSDLSKISDQDALRLAHELSTQDDDRARAIRLFERDFQKTYGVDDDMDDDDAQYRKDKLEHEGQKARKELLEKQRTLTQLDQSTEVREFESRLEAYKQRIGSISTEASAAAQNLEAVMFSVDGEELTISAKNQDSLKKISSALANPSGNLGESILDILSSKEDGSLDVREVTHKLYLADNITDVIESAVQHGRSLERREVARGGTSIDRSEQQTQKPPQQESPLEKLARERVKVY